MAIFGFCDAKSKHEIYSKDDYLILEETLPKLLTPTTEIIKSVEYPKGFTAHNTVVISKMFSDVGDLVPDYYTTEADNDYICVELTDEYINVTIVSETAHDFSGYKYKVVLMKYKD